MKKRVLLIGEPMALFIANSLGELKDVKDYILKVAGAELNVALGLKRLGYDVEYVTKLGYDPLSEMVKDFITKHGIGTKYIKYTSEYNVGMMLKGKTEVGDPKIAYYRKNSAASHITIKDVEDVDIKEFDLLHITGISLCISKEMNETVKYLLDKAIENNVYVSFDPNLRLQMWESKEQMQKEINDISKKVNIVLPGINEANLLLNTNNLDGVHNKYLELGVNEFVVKDGSNGSYYFKDKEKVFVPSFKVKKVIDTVGAGDGFAVGIISGILEKLSLEKILERANAIGSIQVQHISDNEGLPTREELEKYIRSYE